jgi:hypothetical protein
LRESVAIAAQVAEGLEAAHARGLVHRDVKPANILLQETGPGLNVKLSDFGLARAIDDARLTHSGFIAGTPQYMAPEQARGEAVDHRADLFSLGSVLYAMCTGRPPFRARNVPAVLRRVCDETPRPIESMNPGTPPWLVDLIEGLHEKDREERCQSAAEVAHILNWHRTRMEPGAVQRGGSPPVHKPRQRPQRRLWVLLLCLLAVGFLLVPVLIIVGWWLFGDGSPLHSRVPDWFRGAPQRPEDQGNVTEPAEHDPQRRQEPEAPVVPDAEFAKLRYAFKPDELYVYSVQLEAEHDETRELFGGSAIYAVKHADAEGVTLTVRGGMSRFHAPKPGALPRPGIGLMGPPTFPVQAMAEQNEITMDPRGHIHRSRVQANLPLGLGPMIQLVLVPFDARARKSWKQEGSRVVVEESERDPWDGPFVPGLHRMPLGPRRLGPWRDAPTRLSFEVRERIHWTLGVEKAGLRTIHKRVDLESVEQANGRPRWQLSMDGDVLFDSTLGIPRSASLNGEKSVVTGNRQQRQPISLAWRLLEGEERERVLNPPPAKLPEQKPPTAEEISRSIQELESKDTRVRREAAKLLARAAPNDQRAEVAEGLEKLLGDIDHFARLAAIEALGTWGTQETVPLLIQKLSDEDPFTRKAAILALGKLNDPRAAAPITQLLPDFLYRGDASQALQRLGSAAEKPVLALLNQEDVALRVEVCNILKAVGTQDSVKHLEETAKAVNPLVSRAANEALGEVRKRAMK